MQKIKNKVTQKQTKNNNNNSSLHIAFFSEISRVGEKFLRPTFSVRCGCIRVGKGIHVLHVY